MQPGVPDHRRFPNTPLPIPIGTIPTQCDFMLSFQRLDAFNCWSLRPVVTLALEGVLNECSVTLSQFLDAWRDVECPADRMGAVDRLNCAASGEGSARWLVALAIELQLQATGFRARSWIQDQLATGESSMLSSVVAMECELHPMGEECFRAAARIWQRIAENTPANIVQVISDLQDHADELRLYEADRYLVREARRRGIPIHRLGNSSFLQLGEGSRQTRVRITDSSAGQLLGCQIANDKLLTKSIWSRLGLPIPQGREVVDADDAVAAAAELGGLVVVKPRDADYGNGVTLRLKDPADIRVAYDKAREESDQVLVERYLEGSLHRLLVVQGELLSVIKREPASVVGDGVHTIAELVERENRNPRRGIDHRWPLHRMAVQNKEKLALAKQGLSDQSIPDLGTWVRLRDDLRIVAGGVTTRVTADVHPETRQIALEAVLAVGLDIAGIDLIAQDISLPLEQQGGGLLEVNEEPALYIHLPPLCTGDEQHIASAVLRAQYPSHKSGQMPAAVVIGAETANRVVENLKLVCRNDAALIGCSTPFRTTIAGRQLVPPTNSPADRWRTLVLNSSVRRGALSVDWNELVERGLGIERLRTLVLTESSTQWSDSAERLRAICRWITRAQRQSRYIIVDHDDPIWNAQSWRFGDGHIAVSMERTHTVLMRCQSHGRLWATHIGSEYVMGRGTSILATWPAATEVESPTKYALLARIAGWTLSSKTERVANREAAGLQPAATV